MAHKGSTKALGKDGMARLLSFCLSLCNLLSFEVNATVEMEVIRGSRRAADPELMAGRPSDAVIGLGQCESAHPGEVLALGAGGTENVFALKGLNPVCEWV